MGKQLWSCCKSRGLLRSTNTGRRLPRFNVACQCGLQCIQPYLACNRNGSTDTFTFEHKPCDRLSLSLCLFQGCVLLVHSTGSFPRLCPIACSCVQYFPSFLEEQVSSPLAFCVLLDRI